MVLVLSFAFTFFFLAIPINYIIYSSCSRCKSAFLKMSIISPAYLVVFRNIVDAAHIQLLLEVVLLVPGYLYLL